MHARNMSDSERVEDGGAWDAAIDLARWVISNGGPPTMPSPVVLDPGELLHADLWAHGWRYQAIDVVYQAPRVVAFGGLMVFGLAALGSAAARRRARRDAESRAVPQWRPLGALRVLATNRRLLVWHDGAWASVWLNSILELHPMLDARRLDLTFEGDPAYCLTGPWVPYLAVVVGTVLAELCGVGPVTSTIHIQ